MTFEKKLLPVVRPKSHSASVLEYTDGRLMVTWFTGTREGTEDQIGVASTLKPGTSEWSRPETLIRMFEYDGDRWVTEQVVPIENASGESLLGSLEAYRFMVGFSLLSRSEIKGATGFEKTRVLLRLEDDHKSRQDPDYKYAW